MITDVMSLLDTAINAVVDLLSLDYVRALCYCVIVAYVVYLFKRLTR